MALIFVFFKLKKTLPEIIAEVEKLAADGVIDAKDRKKIVLKAINVIVAEFGIDLGWIARIAISFMVDRIAKKLPCKDIVVEDALKEVIAKEPKKRKRNLKRK